MKKIKYLFILFLSLFIMVGCDSSNESEKITYDEFKTQYDNKESINYNHVTRNKFVGYIDDFQNRESDGTPIFEEISMNYTDGNWYNDLGNEYGVYDMNNAFYVLDESTVEAYGNPLNSISYYKMGENYKVIIKRDDSSFNTSTENAFIFPVTIIIIFNKYFYMIDYFKEIDELLPDRVHDNLILWEEHVRWDVIN